MTKNKTIKILGKLNKFDIKQKFRAEIIGIFGSFARGEQRKGSDIDILVEFSTDADLLDYSALSNYLEEVLRQKVDIVSQRAVKEKIRSFIMKDLVTL